MGKHAHVDEDALDEGRLPEDDIIDDDEDEKRTENDEDVAFDEEEKRDDEKGDALVDDDDDDDDEIDDDDDLQSMPRGRHAAPAGSKVVIPRFVDDRPTQDFQEKEDSEESEEDKGSEEGGYSEESEEDAADYVDDLVILPPEASGSEYGTKGGLGKQGKGEEQSPGLVQSLKTRKKLIVIVVLVVLLIGGVCFAGVRLLLHSNAATDGSQSKDGLVVSSASDATISSSKKVEVPHIIAAMGKTQDEAVAIIGHGAQALSSVEEDDEDSDIKTSVTLVLNEDPAAPHSGYPSVTLGLDEDGKVIQVGYSAATSLLGYSGLSFADAITKQHVVENTLAEAGVSVAAGSLELPADKAEYSVYADDGVTLAREKCSFSGAVDESNGVSGVSTWSAVLQYDYSNSNVSGNLNDTIRIINIYFDK